MPGKEEERIMPILLTVVAGLVLGLTGAVWLNRNRKKHKDDLEQHSLTPEVLHQLLSTNAHVLLFDVRQPLDLLAHSEMIPGAKRIPPKEVLENPSLIPKEKDSVVYCTCPSDKTSREILRRTHSLSYSRIKFLRGGLAAWKAMGYPVIPYLESFHLDTRT
jgi:rhodanese-related sulfurtransferase